MRGIRPTLALAALCAFAVLIAGCGGGDSGEDSRPAPDATEFPSSKGKTLFELVEDSGAKEAKLVVSPAGRVVELGPNRYSFGVFRVDGEQVDDADVALYFAKGDRAPAKGPYPARVETLETKAAYRAQGSEGPGEATTAYVVPELEFDREGPWVGIAMLRSPEGLEVTRLTESPDVRAYPKIPKVGEKAPLIHTPTAADVGGDLAKIDTRIPPDQMHENDFADVVGKKPIVLVFATPALCQSRVCGPIVDVVQQVADKYGDEAEFIHMEVYNGNDAGEGVRPQLRAYGLPTEPWTFLIGADGVIKDRIEGAFGVSELEDAMQTILPG